MSAQNLVAVVEAKLAAAQAANNTHEAARWTALLKEAGLLVESGMGIVAFNPWEGDRVELSVKIRKGMKYAIVGVFKDEAGKVAYEVAGQSSTYRAANNAAEKLVSGWGAQYEQSYAIEMKSELVAA